MIQDAGEAVASPERISNNPLLAQRLLDLVMTVPALMWGRDELGAGEMWNSNPVISWLLGRCGIEVDSIHPPDGGRAPGWAAGIVAAKGKDRRTFGANGIEPADPPSGP